MSSNDRSQGKPSGSDNYEADLKGLFGGQPSLAPLASEDRMGRRVTGIDLTQKLTTEQAQLAIAMVDRYNIVSFAGQDKHGFQIGDLERLANHFGAVIAHPKNYANYTAKNEILELLPFERRASTLANQAFPGVIECLDGADSPAVYVVTNLIGSGVEKVPELAGGQHWHTDIEFEPIPLSTSMFYVQRAPTDPRQSTRHLGTNPPREDGFYHPDSTPALSERREALPLNGETAYTDTAAAYAALSPSEQQSWVP